MLCCSIILITGCSPIEDSQNTSKKETDGGTVIEEGNSLIEIIEFTNEDERSPIDPDEYGKSTLEEVFVEYVQAVFDDDAERLMHTLPPFLLDYILADDTDTENYQHLIECFTDYELHNWGILSRKYDVWECWTEKIEQCGDEELQALNDDWYDLFPILHSIDNIEIP